MIALILAILIPLLVSMAFLTLGERKLLASIQLRRGPEITGFLGLLQPFADAIKLFSKETILPNHANIVIFLFAPILTLTLALLSWAIIPWGIGLILADTPHAIIFLLAISSLSIYGLLSSGWASNSKYAFLGALRSTAQMISYEVSLGMLIMTIILCAGSISLTQMVRAQVGIWFILPLLPVGYMLLTSLLAETNRTPFDLPEGESELVSGYNVEYSAMTFALFFLGEYLHIILMSYLFSIILIGGWDYSFSGIFSWGILTIKAVFIILYFIWVRATLPRFRYDQLMHLLWKSYLPLTLAVLLLVPNLLRMVP